MLTEAVLPVNNVLSRSPGCGNVRAEPLDTAYRLALIATHDKLSNGYTCCYSFTLYLILELLAVFYNFITFPITCIKLTI